MRTCVTKLLRRLRIFPRILQEKELRYDQKRAALGISLLLGKSHSLKVARSGVETAIFEVGMCTLVGVALGKIPDSLKLKECDEMWQLVQAAGKAFSAGQRGSK